MSRRAWPQVSRHVAASSPTALDDGLQGAFGIVEREESEQDPVLEQIHAAVARERAALAAELHDGPMQHLTYCAYTLDLIDCRLGDGLVQEALDLLRAARSSLACELELFRQMMVELDPPGDGGRPGNPPGLRAAVVLPGGGERSSQQSGAASLTLVHNGSGHSERSSRDVPPTVLVVDDEANVRRVLVALLKEHNFDVIAEAADGLEAVALAKRLTPEVVLMDIKLPTMDGKQATRLIRAARPSSQVVLLSGDGSPGALADCLAVGAFDLAVKGGSIGTLCETLDRASRVGREYRGTAA